MKLLLTSGGIKNPSIKNELIALLGKPIEDATALAITTAIYANRNGAVNAYRFVSGKAETPMTELGWKSVGLLELSALPTLSKSIWEPWVRSADVLLVNGGDALYLSHWMKTSGFADLLPELNCVYVGLSAGSMVMSPRIGSDFVGWNPDGRSDETLGLVPFSIFPHLDHPKLTDNILPTAIKWAKEIGIPAYAIDDDTAIKVVDGTISVITEGHWHYFDPKQTSSFNDQQ